jgi:DNA-directed RNA polymerase specialized sigma24 family protein
MTNDLLIANRTEEDPAAFHTRFWRCYRLLHFIACRVLGGPERADDAIENCWRRASRNPPQFQYQGAFRSWLVRVLIDEALDIFRENARSAQGEMDLRKDSCGARPIAAETAALLESTTEGGPETVSPAINQKQGRT